MSQNSFSGTNYDRWAYENATPGSTDTTLNKIQRKFWVTKQAVVRKLGKDEDEHITSSDSELDAKLELFKSIDDTTWALQTLIEHYQDRVCNLAYEENAMGRFLKEYGKADRTRAGKMMVAVGKTMSYSGQQRLAIRVPLVRLYQEVETFKQRAIQDTMLTLKRMEKSRTEYRGALMWMKNVSQELDPDTYKQLEKFRKVQGHVKQSKARFDKYKLDCLQKVDLLAASRCNMFSHALIMYQNSLILFWEKTAKTMNHVNESFQGYQDFEFTYTKELIDPNRDLDKGNPIKSRKTKKPAPPNDELLDLQASNAQEAADVPPQGENPDLFGLMGPLESHLATGQQPMGHLDESLLDFGNEEEEGERMGDSEDLPMLTPSGPMYGPRDQEDVQLLEELMGGPSNDALEGSGFTAEWNKRFGHEQDNGGEEDHGSPDDEFSQFISDRTSNILASPVSTGPNSDLLQTLEAGSSVSSPRTKSSHKSSSAFLPSQLFDLDQSLYSSKDEQDLLKDFPMPSPARPASVQKQLRDSDAAKKKNAKKAGKDSDMSQWFNLFADLDPLSNPDDIGKTTKEEEKNVSDLL